MSLLRHILENQTIKSYYDATTAAAGSGTVLGRRRLCLVWLEHHLGQSPPIRRQYDQGHDESCHMARDSGSNHSSPTCSIIWLIIGIVVGWRRPVPVGLGVGSGYCHSSQVACQSTSDAATRQADPARRDGSSIYRGMILW